MAWGAHMTARYTVRPTGTREEHAVYRVHKDFGWKETLCYGETFAHAMFIAECLRQLTEDQITIANNRTVEAADKRRAA